MMLAKLIASESVKTALCLVKYFPVILGCVMVWYCVDLCDDAHDDGDDDGEAHDGYGM